MRHPQGDSALVPLSRIAEFALLGSLRRFVCYPAAALPAEVAGGAAEITFESSNVQLLKFWCKVIGKESIGNGSFATSSTRDVMEEGTRLYLRWPADGMLVAVRPKRSSLEQALASPPAALAALKARKGSISSEAELVAAGQVLAPTIVAGR